MIEAADLESARALWPQVEDLVPPGLPPEIAVSRLLALARSLLIENRQLREIVGLMHDPRGGSSTGAAEAA